MAADKPCTLILHQDSSEIPQVRALKKTLELGTDEERIVALKKVILMAMNGESPIQLRIAIFRFIMPLKNHMLKKLVLLYLEVVDKNADDGSFLLVCNALLSDLNYPNEYVRGSTLRFLCKLKEPELVTPLVESVRNNLEHRHAYVRRNAVLALYSICSENPHLVPDAADVIAELLSQEGDLSCKRNSLLMLFNCARDKAVEYLDSVLDQVQNFGEILQLVLVEMIRKIVHKRPQDRGKYLRCIFTLLQAQSTAVRYEAAITLVNLSSAPTAVKAAASTYIELLVRASDNNVKLIVLDRLVELKEKYMKILQKLTMDVLRALQSPNMTIRKKTLSIVLDLVNPYNIHEVIGVFKKEIARTQSEIFENGAEYRQLLVKAIHTCAVRFPDEAADVVHVLMDYLGDDNPQSALDVIEFVREVIETYPGLRKNILSKLLDSFTLINAPMVFRSALWILGEFSTTVDEIKEVMGTIEEVVGDPNFSSFNGSEAATDATAPPAAIEGGGSPAHAAAAVVSKPVILPDGTYATSSALSSVASTGSGKSASSKKEDMGPLLMAVMRDSKDCYLASTLGSTLTKLCMKMKLHSSRINRKEYNRFYATVLLYITSLMKACCDPVTEQPRERDSYERLVQCLTLLTHPSSISPQKYLNESRESFVTFLKQHQESVRAEHLVNSSPKNEKIMGGEVDSLIQIRQLNPSGNSGVSELDQLDLDLDLATGTIDENYSSRLNKIFQLTGYSDPIYAEAYVSLHQYDILVEVTIINQTPDTLQNLSLELSTLGDLKLVERPQRYTVAPYGQQQITANIKVSSTDTGVIFGCIVYNVGNASSGDKTVILKELHIDIVDYITPMTTSDQSFRQMWADFEWENKIAVNTNVVGLQNFLDHIVTCTNMKCITPMSQLAGDCGFLAANLYAKSVFGEDALANIAIEEKAEGKIVGYIRIRSKTQGIAISLGDKITQKQKV